jgi:hypothetical protein
VTSFFFRPLQKFLFFFSGRNSFSHFGRISSKKKDRLFFLLFLEEEEGRFFVDRFKLFPPPLLNGCHLFSPPTSTKIAASFYVIARLIEK